MNAEASPSTGTTFSWPKCAEPRRLVHGTRARVDRDRHALARAVLGLLTREVPGDAVDDLQRARAEPLVALGPVDGVLGRRHVAVRVERQVRDPGAGRVVVRMQLVVEEHLDHAGGRLVPPDAVRHAGHLVVADDVARGAGSAARRRRPRAARGTAVRPSRRTRRPPTRLRSRSEPPASTPPPGSSMRRRPSREASIPPRSPSTRGP